MVKRGESRPALREIEGEFVGLAVAREARTALLFADDGRLILVDAGGDVLAETVLNDEPVAADVSDDGRVIAAVTRKGRLFWFDRTLARRRTDVLDTPPCALALTLDGSHAAVATIPGPILILDCYGQRLAMARCPRSIDRLVFLDERPGLVAMSEQGQLACFDADGAVRFQKNLSMRLSDVTADPQGEVILIAAPALGLMGIDSHGEPRRHPAMIDTPAEAALSPDRSKLLVATLEPKLLLVELDGMRLMETPLPAQPVRVGMDALAQSAWCLLEGGRAMGIDLGA